MNLSALVTEVCERLSTHLAAADCALSCAIEPDVVGWWDKSYLERAVTNIVSNAVKYGRGKPIDVTVARDGGRARVIVRDRGIGVASADRERIFQRFERAVSSSNYGGFGLGLWIARETIGALAGTVNVTSEVGAGAEFVIELPVTSPGAPRSTQPGRART